MLVKIQGWQNIDQRRGGIGTRLKIHLLLLVSLLFLGIGEEAVAGMWEGWSLFNAPLPTPGYSFFQML